MEQKESKMSLKKLQFFVNDFKEYFRSIKLKNIIFEEVLIKYDDIINLERKFNIKLSSGV